VINKIFYITIGAAITFVLFPQPAQDNQSGISPIVLGTSTQNVNIEKKYFSAPEMAISLSPPTLTTRAALAYDLNSDIILYSNNLNTRLPIASLTKLVTALVVVNNSDLENVVTVEKADTQVVGSNMGLVAGEKIKILDLLYGMLVSSSNDAAMALARSVGGSTESFNALMNKEAQKLKLLDTHFTNPVGWDLEDNYSTVLDLKIILSEFFKNSTLSEIVNTREKTISSIDSNYSHKLISTNKLLLENSNVSGVKTGFTTKALGNLIIKINKSNAQVVTIVLNSQEREQDTEKLIDWLFTVYRW